MDQVASFLDRPKLYNNIDGVGELSTGVMCLGYALLEWLQVTSPEHSLWNGMPFFAIYVAVMCAVIHYGSKAIKKHITYPRTGFVAYRRRDTIWVPLILGFVGSAIFSAGLALAARRRFDFTTPVALVGLLLAAAYAYGFARTERWKWTVAVVMAFGSVAIGSLPAEVVGAVATHSWLVRLWPAKIIGAFFFTMALYGSLLLISGGISFVLYLRRTTSPAPETE